MLLESNVFTELVKNRIDEIRFWRTQDKAEIDFIIQPSLALEVKLNQKSFRLSSYRNFITHYPEINLMPVTLEHDNFLDILDICC